MRCLARVLEFDPHNPWARQGLNYLRAGVDQQCTEQVAR